MLNFCLKTIIKHIENFSLLFAWLEDDIKVVIQIIKAIVQQNFLENTMFKF